MIAIISDVHGNFPALEAVLEEIDRAGCECIISLGDVAGYHCEFDECAKALIERRVDNIMGNHDRYLTSDERCSRSNSVNLLVAHQRERAATAHLEWLRRSPIRIDRGEASFVHGGWRDPTDEYLTEPTADYFSNLSARFFFSGHTHVQALTRVGRGWHCNPGSVGQPRDGDPRAAFALFDGESVRLRRVTYDIDRTAAAMERNGFGRYYYAGLYMGRGIGAVTKVGSGRENVWGSE